MDVYPTVSGSIFKIEYRSKKIGELSTLLRSRAAERKVCKAVLVSTVFIAVVTGCSGNAPLDANLPELSVSHDEQNTLIPSASSSSPEFVDNLEPVEQINLPELLPHKQTGPDIRMGETHNGEEQPEYRRPQREQPNGNWLTRVTDNETFGLPDGDATHAYSRRQVWNITETFMMLGNRILNATTNQIEIDHIPLSSERVWSNTKSHLIYGFQFSPLRNVFSVWDMNSDLIRVLFRFDEFSTCGIGGGEGNLSNYDNFVVVSCFKPDSERPTLLSLDLELGVIIGRTKGQDNFNWASFSQSGEFIVVENNSEAGEELVRYSKWLSDPIQLTQDRDHGDLGIDGDGDDVFVMISRSEISFIRLRDALKVSIPFAVESDELGYGHITCRNIRRPGWCFMSANNNLFVGSFRVRRQLTGVSSIDDDINGAHIGVTEFEPWGSHRSSVASYHATPRLSVSPSGNKIVYASDWYGRGEIAAYSVQYTRPEFTD